MSSNPASAPPKSTLGERTRRSSIATLLGYGAASVLRLASNLLLARLLLPESFGLMQHVLVVLIGLSMFSDIGAGASVVHSRRGDDPLFLDTAFTVQVLRGFALGLLSLVIGPLYAHAVDVPELAIYIPVAALSSILSGLNSTRLYTAERNVAVARKVALDVGAQVVALVVMLVWAYLSPSVWALVAGSITQSALLMFMSHVALPGHPNRLRIDRSALKEVIQFGRWIFLSTALTFFAMQMDKLLLGQLEELGAFGVYGIAFAIASLPQTIGAMLTGTVLYPVLAEYARDSRATLAEHFQRSRALLLDAAGFSLLGVVLLAPPFFRLCYKAEYHDATWIAPLLVVPLWFAILQITADRACLALGEPRVLTLSNLANLVAKGLGATIGFRFAGLPGFVLGLTAGTLSGHLVVRRALARMGLPIAEQDRGASLRLVALALPAALLPHAFDWGWIPGVRLEGTDRSLFEIAVALCVLVPVGVPFARRMATLRRR